MAKRGLSKAAVARVHAIVDLAFDRAIERFLAKPAGSKKITISPKVRITLPGLYQQAAREERSAPNEDTSRALIAIAKGFIDAQRESTKAHVVKVVQDWVRKDPDADVATVLKGELHTVWQKATTGMRRIVETESTTARNSGALDGIVKFSNFRGVDDPVVYFVVVHDDDLCDECQRLHLMPDGVTPRLWHLSEVGGGYHTKGQDNPKISGLHPHCFTGEMRLHTDRGLLTAEELFRQGGTLDVVVDARIKNRRESGNQFGKLIPGQVWLDRHSSGARSLPATNVYDTGVQECLRIHFDTGSSLEVSFGHEMWIDDNKNGKKVRADQVKVGDKVPLLSGEGCWGSDNFPELAELMGNLMGDGTLGNTAKWNFFGNDIEYGNLLKKKAAKFSPCLDEEMAVHKPDEKYTVRRATFNSTVLARVFVKDFGLSKTPRRVPSRLWGADKVTVSGFLRGLYAADGHSESTPAIVLAQNDREFLLEVQALLSNFGIRARLFKHGDEISKPIEYADGRVFDTNRKVCWRLSIGGWDQVALFARQIGMGVPSKQQTLLERLAVTEGAARLGAWRTARVESIQPIGLKQTYCLTEPMTNTVTANGIVTGNCRCSLVHLAPGFGFTSSGSPEYVSPGHDEIKKQRG